MTTHDLPDILDRAIAQRQSNKPMTPLLDADATQLEMLYPLLAVVDRLDMLDSVQMPSAEELIHDRNAFLAEIAYWQIQTVSPTGLGRLKRWITTNRWWFWNRPTTSQKEIPIMNSVIAKLVVVLVLVFGSIGGVAAASTNSLPGSSLYPVKLVLEDTQLAITGDPAAITTLYLSFAQERIQEMATMVANGDDPGEATVLRLKNDLQNAIIAAAQITNDATLLSLLTQTQQTLQTQAQTLAQIQVNGSVEMQNRFVQAQTIYYQILGEVESGLQNPALFRERHTHNRPEDAPVQPQITPRPNSTITPFGTPHSYGPGDGTPNCGNCTPIGGAYQYGPGQPGGNPNATPQPTGTAYQNGPGQPGGNPNATPQPTGTAHQYGPQPTQSGPGQPGGNPNVTPQPTGTAHQYGPQPTQPGPGQPGGNPNATPKPTCTVTHPQGPQATHSAPGGPDGSGGNSGH